MINNADFTSIKFTCAQTFKEYTTQLAILNYLGAVYMQFISGL